MAAEAPQPDPRPSERIAETFKDYRKQSGCRTTRNLIGQSLSIKPSHSFSINQSCELIFI
ncbi:hypothetical protein BDI4_300066 [Burkholderia diffusa]|nr:hypothetical protein BDI4_300066 [Burkholderia diffusa]